MANKFVSVLDKVGRAFQDVFKVALPAAEAAEPFIDVFFPGFAALYNLSVTLVKNTEAAAAAAGAQAGTGPQKLALVLASLQPYVAAEAAALGVKNPTIAQTTAYINAVVAGLNAFEALSAAPVGG